MFPSLALGVQGLEAALAVAVSAGVAQTSHRILVAHGAFHLFKIDTSMLRTQKAIAWSVSSETVQRALCRQGEISVCPQSSVISDDMEHLVTGYGNKGHSKSAECVINVNTATAFG